jgi:hypothetical protein
MYKKCAQCGLEFKSFPSRKNHQCCSAECAAVFKRKPAEIKPGDVFGKNTVMDVRHFDRRWHGLTRCDCGAETWRPEIDLLRNRASSCVCMKSEITRKAKTRHGMSRTKTHRAWSSMLDRCYRKSNASYPRYGGRGITVCDRWRDCFECFLEDMGTAPAGHSLDRIDNDGPYSPENCRWVDAKTQSNNTRANTRIQHNGKSRTVAQWAEETGIGRTTIHYRIRAAMPADLVFKPERINPYAEGRR